MPRAWTKSNHEAMDIFNFGDLFQLGELGVVSGRDAVMLVVLALIDSTSTGTLVLPLALLVFTSAAGSAGARAVALRVVLYLFAIGVFYWLIGLALLSGAQVAVQPLTDMFASRTGAVILVILGAVLVVVSWWIDPKVVRKRGGDPEASTRRWVARAERAVGHPLGVLVLAVGAGLVEVATMLPYLAAMGGLVRYDLSLPTNALVLVGYCLIMIAPGLVLAAARFLLGTKIEKPLTRLRDAAVRATPTTMAWVTGIVGVVILLRVGPTLFTG